MLLQKICHRNFLIMLGIILVLLLGIFLFWYYTPGLGLPKLEQADITKARIIEGYPDTDPRYRQMREIQDMFHKHWKGLMEELDITILSCSVDSNDNTLEIETTRLGIIEERILKGKIFDAIGIKFNLRIKTVIPPEEPTIVGKITEINLKEKKLLIVNEEVKLGDGEEPDAIWIRVREDTKLKRKGGLFHKKLAFKDFQIGQNIKAWDVGFRLQTYPGQAGIVEKIVILDRETSE